MKITPEMIRLLWTLFGFASDVIAAKKGISGHQNQQRSSHANLASRRLSRGDQRISSTRMGKVTLEWIRFFYPIILYTCIVYWTLMICSLLDIYPQLDRGNPITLVAYASYLHLITIPLLVMGMKGMSNSFYLYFSVFNLIWIIACITILICIQQEKCEYPLIS